MKITKEYLREISTEKGGWRKAQLEILGIKWPPPKGWQDRVIGDEISENDSNLLKALKNISGRKPRGPRPKRQPRQNKRISTKKEKRLALRKCHKAQALLLRNFWSKIQDGSTKSHDDKIKLLVQLAEEKIPQTKYSTYQDRRREFSKDSKFQGLIRSPCFSCGGKSEHRHHIIQLQNGGLNTLLNVIPVCYKCHARIHPWIEVEEELEDNGHLDSIL